jgi:hypothetical protein
MDLGSIYRRFGEGSRQLEPSGKEVGVQKAPAPRAPSFSCATVFAQMPSIGCSPHHSQTFALNVTKVPFSLTTRSVPQLETEPALRSTQIGEMVTLNCSGPAQFLLNVGL